MLLRWAICLSMIYLEQSGLQIISSCHSLFVPIFSERQREPTEVGTSLLILSISSPCNGGYIPPPRSTYRTVSRQDASVCANAVAAESTMVIE